MILARFLQNTFNYNQEQQQKPDTSSQSEFLPEQLAGKILDLEMECEGTNASKELIAQLITHYTAAVQFYQANGSQKYKIYQKRMQTFLSRPTVDDILNGKLGSLVIKKDLVQKNKLQASISSKEEVNRIIEKSQKNVESHKKIIDKAIKNQQINLEARIQRRKSMSNRSTKTDNDDFDDENHCNKPKPRERMNVRLILNGIKERNIKRVFI